MFEAVEKVINTLIQFGVSIEFILLILVVVGMGYILYKMYVQFQQSHKVLQELVKTFTESILKFQYDHKDISEFGKNQYKFLDDKFDEYDVQKAYVNGRLDDIVDDLKELKKLFIVFNNK